MNNNHSHNTIFSLSAVAKRFSIIALLCVKMLMPNVLHAHDLHEHSEEQTKQTHLGLTTSVDQLIKQYSLSGDDHLLNQGWQLLSPNLQSDAPSVQHYLQAAQLSQAEHKFSNALDYLKLAFNLQPNNAQAWILKASIHTVLGNNRLARQACNQVALSLSLVTSMACKARLAETSAQRERAYQQLSKSIEHESSIILRSWAQSITAELAVDLGHIETAERLFKSSVKAFPSVQVRSAYADLLISENRPAEALQLLNGRVRAPALEVRRMQAKQNLSLNIDSEIERVDTLFQQWIKHNDYRHAREMAMFYLYIDQQPQLAYKLAEKNLQSQQEPQDKKLFLAAKDQLNKQADG